VNADKIHALEAQAHEISWFEATARQRLRWFVDTGSFEEFLGPAAREMSPHLPDFNLPEAFDDGMIVGRAKLDSKPVLIAAQEGQFMGGAFGEVHGAKLTGLLRGARDAKGPHVVILFDTGGVRLQEANVGELAIAEIMRAVLEARAVGVKVVGLVGGRAGCFGGGSLVAACCSALAISEQGRIGISGPEVIETNRGVEEFDSKDRALVWRTMGGKHRRLLGGVELFVGSSIQDFRDAARTLLAQAPNLSLDILTAEQARLEERLERFGKCVDGLDVWKALGAKDPAAIPGMAADAFIHLAETIRRPRYDAR
jgi:malonate decarboxylase beta subunit